MSRSPWTTRRLWRNHACQRPSHFVFVDTETRWESPARLKGRKAHRLRLGIACAVDWPKGRGQTDEWFTFTDTDAFWKWLEGKQHEKRSLWVVGHNMVFDFTILKGWGRLETQEYRVRTDAKSYRDPRTGRVRDSRKWQGLCAIDGRPFHIETQGSVGRVNFTDLMNYYPCSLAEVGGTVGLSKLPRPADSADGAEWSAYCYRDVEILKAAYLGLVDQWQRDDLGNWSLSGPSLSWNNYRHKHMTTPVVLHGHGNARDLEWDAYYPGEVRAWYRGDCPGPVVHYDVNSLYPAVMLAYEYPYELIDHFYKPKPAVLESLMSRYAVIVRVDLETTRDEYPYRRAGRILYPVGRFTTSLAGPEFIRAWSEGKVRAVREVAYYKRARLFSSFVPYWWERKRQAGDSGDLAGEKFAKLIANGLPGKFCQRNPTWQFDPRIEVLRPWRPFPWKHPDTGVVHNARAIGWEGQYAAERKDAAHCFPAIGAFVTSYARVRMREMRQNVPPSALYYQDTDSLMVADGPECWEWIEKDHCGSGLGQLRTVTRSERVTIRGPKNYTCDGVHTISGVRERDVEVAAMQFVGERFEGTPQLVTREPDGTVESWQRDFESPGSCLEGGYRPDGWSFPIQIS